MTNTNWQWYSGELTMSHLTQMLGLNVQNFVSAAAGMAVVVAIIRGITRRGQRTLGNFWVDLVRTTLRILLPLSFLVAVLLMAGGVVQNLAGRTAATPVDPAVAAEVTPVDPRRAGRQPGRHQAARHERRRVLQHELGPPVREPRPFTNFVETWAIIVVPIALVVTYGMLVGSKKQARVLLAVMAGIWLVDVAVHDRRRELRQPGADGDRCRPGLVGAARRRQPRGQGDPLRAGDVRAVGGDDDGHVQRLGQLHARQLTPIGGMVPMVHMMFGEVGPGGVGVGLMGMLVYALLAVFIAGLMVGRTPEYLGKKIQAAEMKLVMLYLIAMPIALLGLRRRVGGAVVGELDDLQPRTPRPLRGPLQLRVGRQQQRSAFAGHGTGTDWYTVTRAWRC